MTLLNYLLLVVALGSAAILFRILLLGYYAALLPLICVIMYMPLEFVWVYTGSDKLIGTLQDTVWALLEMGVIGGGSWLAWTIKRDGDRVRKELMGDADRDRL